MADEKIIIEVEVDTRAAEKNIQKQTQVITDLTQRNKELAATNKELSKDYDRNRKDISALNEQIAKNKSAITSANQSRRASIKEIQSENNSLNAISAQLSKNIKRRKEINTSTKAGQKEFRRLTKEIKSQNDQLKAAEQAGGNFSRSVGDYGSAINGLIPGLGGATQGIQALTSGSLAFIATPIGAVITALGLAVAALTTYFRGSEKGQNDLLKVTETLSAVFGVLRDGVIATGEAIFEAISNPKETVIELGDLIVTNLINRFKAFAVIGEAVVKIIEGDFAEGFKQLGNGAVQAATGIENISEVAQNAIESIVEVSEEAGKKLDENLKRAEDIARRQAKVDKREREILVERARLETQVAELRLKAKDEERLSAQERIDALEEAQRLTDEVFAKEVVQARDRLKIQQQRNAQSESTKEDLLEEAQLQADLIRLEQQRLNANRKLETEIQTNIKKRNAELAKEAAQKEADAKKQQEEDDAFFARNDEIRAKQREQRLKDEEDQKQKDLEITQKTEEAKGIILQNGAALATKIGGEQSVAAKAAGIGQATISTYTAIVKALELGPIAGPIASASIGALGFANVANIAGVQFANGGLVDGGMFEGASHANGGIKFASGGRIMEAEGGEAIINKRSTAMFRPVLSAINSAGGGKKFAKGGEIPKFANGGTTFAGMNTSSIDSAIAGENSVANQLSKQAPVQVAVTDINRGQDNVSVKQNRASV